uniref:Lissencephaly type 1 y n=1 Tax=Echinococcus granulosus TaxID=6210 RepID=A0A068W8J4_ECHGR|nr:Lissencephaly type 1 y [Echinococcus granulosus]
MSEFVCEQYVRRYLMSHNYFRTLTVFDGESSANNLGGCFQPSKIVESISRAIAGLDYETLENIWKGLGDSFSSQLDRQNSAKFESLKAYTFKALLCAAVKSKQIACLNEFFSGQRMFDLSSSAWLHWSQQSTTYLVGTSRRLGWTFFLCPYVTFFVFSFCHFRPLSKMLLKRMKSRSQAQTNQAHHAPIWRHWMTLSICQQFVLLNSDSLPEECCVYL